MVIIKKKGGKSMELSKNENKRKRCIKLNQPVYVENSASIVGLKKGLVISRKVLIKYGKIRSWGRTAGRKRKVNCKRRRLIFFCIKRALRKKKLTAFFRGIYSASLPHPVMVFYPLVYQVTASTGRVPTVAPHWLLALYFCLQGMRKK